ncbi:uncharacterized protein N7484_010361 [Penicillium longicatenatum]|uniref:uncharacterized protein n=1 Tax=Penicillium longicatenatum TaxID=1561947 RepID=UPI002548B3CB|nr:uncharacterized protein N7484_010361 [Penicillium longicatenatum]KAJ5630261.1 hypothetical protein N7484_010361 [Penicillium longicatenatum]
MQLLNVQILAAVNQKRARGQLPYIEPWYDFDWRAQQPKELRPFKPIYNMSMGMLMLSVNTFLWSWLVGLNNATIGLQRESLSNLITIDSQYLDRTTIRREIVSQYQNTVYGYRPGGEGAVYELYSYILTHYLPRRFPGLFKVESGEFKNLMTKQIFPAEPPKDPETCLKILAETIEEDIFLLKETEATHMCLAFACCFPAGFDPSSKLGADLAAIHGPVPHYDKIGPSMERYFRKIQPGQVVRRMNWNVQVDEELINISGNHIKKGDSFVEDDNIDCSKASLLLLYAANLRIELQSLTRLPDTKFILFCFKTFMYPLESLKRDGSAADLADAIEGMRKGNAPDMHRYKSAIRWGKSVVEYLRSSV